MPNSHNCITHFAGTAREVVTPFWLIPLYTLGLLLAAVLAGCAAGANEVEEEAMGLEDLPMPIIMTSSAFKDGSTIPRKFTCDGTDISPPLAWSGLPAGAQSLALIVDDPDAPGGDWVHWIVYDLPASAGGLMEDVGQSGAEPGGGVQGNNSWRRSDYGGPCPPSGTHRYFFSLYALDTRLNLDPGSTRLQVEQVMEGHVMGQGQLMGRYSR
jgi:Raf kinase inhibitor-like YbhB/YbcL family protein